MSLGMVVVGSISITVASSSSSGSSVWLLSDMSSVVSCLGGGVACVIGVVSSKSSSNVRPSRKVRHLVRCLVWPHCGGLGEDLVDGFL